MAYAINAANNVQPPSTTHCIGQALAAKGLSILLDAVGAVPPVGNLVSGSAATIRGIDAFVSVGGAVVGTGNALLNPDPVGGASAGTSLVLAVTDVALDC